MTDHDQVDLDDELWTWRHIGAWTHRGRSAAYRLTTLPGFPAPLDLDGDAVWVAAEVKAHLLSRRAAPRRRRTSQPDPVHASSAPGTVTVRPRRAAGRTRSAAA